MADHLTRWQASAEADDPTGIATFSAGDYSVDVRLDSFERARALNDLIGMAVSRAKKSQAAYLRGAINRTFDEEA